MRKHIMLWSEHMLFCTAQHILYIQRAVRQLLCFGLMMMGPLLFNRALAPNIFLSMLRCAAIQCFKDIYIYKYISRV